MDTVETVYGLIIRCFTALSKTGKTFFKCSLHFEIHLGANWLFYNFMMMLMTLCLCKVLLENSVSSFCHLLNLNWPATGYETILSFCKTELG